MRADRDFYVGQHIVFQVYDKIVRDEIDRLDGNVAMTTMGFSVETDSIVDARQFDFDRRD